MTTEIKALVDQIGAKHAEIDTALKTVGTDAKSAVEKATQALDRIMTLGNQILEIEQKTADAVKRGTESPATLGRQVVASDSFKKFAEGFSSKIRIEVKAAGTILTGTPANTLVAPDRQAGIVAGAFRPLRLRDVLTTVPTTSNAIDFTRETSFTNGAAPVAEGAKRAQSGAGFELVSLPVRTIGHFFRVSKQIRNDAPALAAYIDTRVKYGVDFALENQILLGDGTGQNLSGMTSAGNFTLFNPTAAEQQLDAINRAIYKCDAAGYPATVVVMNPEDLGDIERLKGADGHYLIGNPTGIIGPVLWSKPVVLSSTMPRGKFLVANMEVAFQYWAREEVAVEMSESDEDNFTSGLVTIRGEVRGALASYVPAAAQFGSLLAE